MTRLPLVIGSLVVLLAACASDEPGATSTPAANEAAPATAGSTPSATDTSGTDTEDALGPGATPDGTDTADAGTSGSTPSATDTSGTDTAETGTTDALDPDTSGPAGTVTAGTSATGSADANGADAAATDTAPGSAPSAAAPPGSCSSVPRGRSNIVLDGGGAVHDVQIFVPDTLLAEPAPVVLNWHGLGSNGPQQAVYSGYEELAAAEGFIAVHATGAENSWELAQFDQPGRDDLAFADLVIDTVVGEWCGDAARVYSTGMSNGGFFTAELVCHRADRIAAAASVAGLSHAEGCEPSRPVPYIAFHGTDDNIVPFDGDGESLLALDGASDVFFTQVMPEEFAEFAADAGCDPEAVVTEETPEVIRYDYTGCENGVPMSFYELPGSGHTWPNSPQAEQLGDAIGYHTSDIDATVDAWAFFEQYSL